MNALDRRSDASVSASAPSQSIVGKFKLALLVYALLGASVLVLRDPSVLAVSIVQHALTFFVVGMYVAGTSGEVLFAEQESDIMLHRPVPPSELLWAKTRVMLEVGFTLAVALNLATFVAGATASNGTWWFTGAHLMSVAVESVLVCALVVLAYGFCLKWLGRERLTSLLTLTQVGVSVMLVIGSQVMSRAMRSFAITPDVLHAKRWLMLLPPVWFAGMNDALAGSRARESFVLAGVGIAATGLAVWLAFRKLADEYGAGLQAMGETTSAHVDRSMTSRVLPAMVRWPLLRSWLRDPVSRAAFVLTGAYLVRDRDLKLRLYPAIVPMLIWPVLVAFPTTRIDHGVDAARSVGAAFGPAFAVTYLALIPTIAMETLERSSQFAAADVFRLAPLAGPGALVHGMRRAVMALLVVPMVLIVAALLFVVSRDPARLTAMAPGLLLIPLFAMRGSRSGDAIPLARALDGVSSASRGAEMLLMLAGTALFATLAAFAWKSMLLGPFILVELAVIVPVYVALRRRVTARRWRDADR